jgi:hypothetical protein
MSEFKTKADLYEAWAKVLRMCGDNRPCFKVGEHLIRPTTPAFDNNPESYGFPIAYIEGKAVFVGDALYRDGGQYVILSDPNGLGLGEMSRWSWNPPKPKTFMLNGVEFPLPDNKPSPEYGYGCHLLGNDYYFKSLDDCNKIRKALGALFDGK